MLRIRLHRGKAVPLYYSGFDCLGNKIPAPIVKNEAGIYYRVTVNSENKPQPELQNASVIGISSRCDRAKVADIADVTVRRAENYCVE